VTIFCFGLVKENNWMKSTDWRVESLETDTVEADIDCGTAGSAAVLPSFGDFLICHSSSSKYEEPPICLQASRIRIPEPRWNARAEHSVARARVLKLKVQVNSIGIERINPKLSPSKDLSEDQVLFIDTSSESVQRAQYPIWPKYSCQDTRSNWK
jgi:hypothetical protein